MRFAVEFGGTEQRMEAALAGSGNALTADFESAIELKYSAAELPVATADILGGIKVGDGLKVTQEGRLSVDAAGQAEQDNTRPITSAAVYAEIGNINSLLETI